jgi:hypothetical protein
MLVPNWEIRELQEFIQVPRKYLPSPRKWPEGWWTMAGQAMAERTYIMGLTLRKTEKARKVLDLHQAGQIETLPEP